jgi:hypothetical protein
LSLEKEGERKCKKEKGGAVDFLVAAMPHLTHSSDFIVREIEFIHNS